MCVSYCLRGGYDTAFALCLHCFRGGYDTALSFAAHLRYTRSNEEFLKAIHRGKLPARLLDEKPCYYYNGWCATPQHGLPSKKMALVTSDCGTMRSLSIKWP